MCRCDYEAAGGVPEAWRQAEITDRPIKALARGVRLVDGGVGQQPGLPVVVPGEKDPAAVADDGYGAFDGFHMHIVSRRASVNAKIAPLLSPWLASGAGHVFVRDANYSTRRSSARFNAIP